MNESTTPWVEGLTIGQVLAATVARRGAAPAIIFPFRDVRWSWHVFAAQVAAAARALLACGIRRGEHVAVWATNVPEWVVLQFATAQIGAVMVTINPAYRPHELKYCLKQSDNVALFLVDQYKSSDYFAMLSEICPELSQCEPGSLTSAAFPKMRLVVTLKGRPLAGALNWESFLARGAQTTADEYAAATSSLAPTDPINVQYTSGTTGFPKAAMLSHRNLLLNAFHIGACQSMTPEDRICIPVPFYHCFGCVLGTMCSVVYGAAMVVPAESFHPAATLAAIESEQATALYGVPTMFIAQLQDPTFRQRNLRSLRTGIMSGSPCPIEVMRQVLDQMGAHELTIAYGQTEASPVITQTRPGDPLELRVETVGRPLPGVEVKIVEPGTSAPLPDNQQGELCTRGHLVMLGYYNNPEATQAAIDREGWLHTGDLATRSPNGYYKITGRIKDLVIRGGENIYPREIEEFLYTHPAVEQVSVVGVPDLKYGEELCAWVKLKAGHSVTADELRDFCKTHLAHYKVPKYVKLVTAFPQTVTGKIQKFRIRELMRDELGISEIETA